MFYPNEGYRSVTVCRNEAWKLKGLWLPVLLEHDEKCTELLIRCADAVA